MYKFRKNGKNYIKFIVGGTYEFKPNEKYNSS